MKKLTLSLLLLAGTGLALPAALVAQGMPANLLPDEQEPVEQDDTPEPDDAVTSSTATGPVEVTSDPVVQQFDPVVQQWLKRWPQRRRGTLQPLLP